MVQVRPDGRTPATGDPRSIAVVDRGAAASSESDYPAALQAAVIAPEAPLDLHKGIFDPPRFEDWRCGCPRWPHGLLLRWQRGELVGYVEGRCRATNLCPYCRILAVVETAEMLWLDAAEHAPGLWIVLTAREHLARRDTYQHLWQLRRSLRRVWPVIEWFVQVEFQRRGALHLNLLVKGVPVDQGEQLLERACRVWCSRVDAEPVGQHIEAMSSAQAVTRYLQKELTHGLKREQAPPIGWRGHRTSQTRGYLVRPAAVMREEARESLRFKRHVWRILRQAPELDAADVEYIAGELVKRDHERAWSVRRLPPIAAEKLLRLEAGPEPAQIGVV